ncbi:MAG: RDD family protein [Acidobacteriota bacterium]
MKCPRCQAEGFLTRQACGGCGFHLRPPRTRDDSAEASLIPFPQNLQFDFSIRDKSAHPERSDKAAWREELKRRLAEVQEKRGQKARPKKDVQGPGLFDRVEGPVVPASGLLERRGAAGMAVPLRAAQKNSSAAPALDPVTIIPQDPPAVLSPDRVDKGILLSRAVSGVVDLLVVFLLTAAFVAGTCLLLRADPLEPGIRRVMIGLVIFFHIFYTVYFLSQAQRTPGMMWLGLRLIGDEGHGPTVQLLLARAILFPFAALTLVGLLWGLLDGKARCLHDLFSTTRVIRD